MRTPLLALALLLTPQPGATEVTIRNEPGRVLVDAQAAPLETVLARFAEVAGLELIYDGEPPRAPLTARVEDTSSVRVLLRLLEGSGLSYALATDTSGLEAVKLYVTTSPTTLRRAPPPREEAPEEVEPFEPDLDQEAAGVAEEPQEDELLDAAPPDEEPAAGLTFPSPNYPTSSFTPRAPSPPLPGQPAAGPSPLPGAEPLSREELLRQRLEQLRQPRTTATPEDQ